MLEVYVIFNGSVQGVGFRATALRLASEFHLTGYVKNLPNSTVELVAQGPKETLQQFITELKNKFHIHEIVEKFSETTHPYSSFSIQH